MFWTVGVRQQFTVIRRWVSVAHGVRAAVAGVHWSRTSILYHILRHRAVANRLTIAHHSITLLIGVCGQPQASRLLNSLIAQNPRIGSCSCSFHFRHCRSIASWTAVSRVDVLLQMICSALRARETIETSTRNRIKRARRLVIHTCISRAIFSLLAECIRF